MFGFTFWEIGWFALTALLGLLMYLSQIDPDGASLNLSKWALKSGVHRLPLWLKGRQADRWVIRIGLPIFVGLVFYAGMIFSKWMDARILSKLDPIIVTIQATSPSLPGTPVTLVPNLQAQVPKEEAERIARYIQLKGLCADAKVALTRLEESGNNWLNLSRQMARGAGPRMADVSKISSAQTWRENVKRLQRDNELAYKNRPFETERVPELANHLLKAPGQDDFGDNAEKPMSFELSIF